MAEDLIYELTHLANQDIAEAQMHFEMGRVSKSRAQRIEDFTVATALYARASARRSAALLIFADRDHAPSQPVPSKEGQMLIDANRRMSRPTSTGEPREDER